MPNIESVLQSGSGNAWLMLPLAVLLGALHALEPGHSKSMMAAFIVAVRGTMKQAALLGLSAAIGHTIVVWVLALLAFWLGDKGMLEKAEPWLLLIGGFLLIILAARILTRFMPRPASGHSHDHDHSHVHTHDGPSDDGEDAHAAAHAAEIEQRFKGHRVSNAEVAWFGFTGGLLPCPSAFAVLLICLHQKAYGLGIVMVAAFSIGLAITLVAVGMAAAWGAKALSERSGVFDTVSRWAPVLSAAIVFCIGAMLLLQGATALNLI